MIYVEDRQSKVNIGNDFINGLKKVIQLTLLEEEVLIPCEISLLFVNNSEIKIINDETRNINKETDVLSFPMLSYESNKVYKDCYKNFEFDLTYLDGDSLVLGDIVLSLEKALEQSIEYNHPFERECSYLIVHSMLHLLGYDHIKANDKKKMREREEEILDLLEIRRG